MRTPSGVSLDRRLPVPSTLWRVDVRARQGRQVRALPPQFDASKDEVEQFEAASSDGTKIPYFIVHPKRMALEGNHPRSSMPTAASKPR
jgi:prolyl oligopeptidase PreP (S9A serine peptidase family)